MGPPRPSSAGRVLFSAKGGFALGLCLLVGWGAASSGGRQAVEAGSEKLRLAVAELRQKLRIERELTRPTLERFEALLDRDRRSHAATSPPAPTSVSVVPPPAAGGPPRAVSPAQARILRAEAALGKFVRSPTRAKRMRPIASAPVPPAAPFELEVRDVKRERQRLVELSWNTRRERLPQIGKRKVASQWVLVWLGVTLVDAQELAPDEGSYEHLIDRRTHPWRETLAFQVRLMLSDSTTLDSELSELRLSPERPTLPSRIWITYHDDVVLLECDHPDAQAGDTYVVPSLVEGAPACPMQLMKVRPKKRMEVRLKVVNSGQESELTTPLVIAVAPENAEDAPPSPDAKKPKSPLPLLAPLGLVASTRDFNDVTLTWVPGGTASYPVIRQVLQMAPSVNGPGTFTNVAVLGAETGTYVVKDLARMEIDPYFRVQATYGLGEGETKVLYSSLAQFSQKPPLPPKRLKVGIYSPPLKSGISYAIWEPGSANATEFVLQLKSNVDQSDSRDWVDWDRVSGGTLEKRVPMATTSHSFAVRVKALNHAGESAWVTAIQCWGDSGDDPPAGPVYVTTADRDRVQPAIGTVFEIRSLWDYDPRDTLGEGKITPESMNPYKGNRIGTTCKLNWD